MPKLSRIVAPTTLALAIVLWTALVLFSLWTQREQLDRTAAALARIDAIANLRKDMSIRKWADTIGGIYIDETKIPAMESLDEQEHLSVTRGTGERFTLVAIPPIHILLAIQEISHKSYGTRERLTSLQLRNRANAPDEWETNALKMLEGGAEMATEALPTKAASHGLLRVMIPMKMEKECLECHRDTLVPVGGLRGGATISIDLNTYRSAQEPTWRTIQYWHSGIWLIGLTTITIFWLLASRRAIEQAHRDEERRENETAFAAMAEGAIITNAKGDILWVNDAFCRIYGYRRDEVIGKNPRLLKSGRHDGEFYREFWRQLTETGHWRGELWNRRKTGEVFPEELSIQALRGTDGSIRRFISIFSDITERKRNEAELLKHQQRLEESEARLRELAAFLQTVREEERTRIARELHDELGQALTALRIDLGWLRGKCGSLGAPAAERVASAFGVVEQSIVSLRRISEDLRPAMLDSLGLAAAVEHHVAQFSQRTGLPCHLSMNREEFDLDGNLATAVFRVVQEALTNVARHAEASEATVSINESDTGIDLVITDDGRGITAPGDKKTFGLLGMRERITMLGGTIDIDSQPDHGTRIACWLPLTKDDQA
ncbi:MAG: PAS domain S-box protein [Rhodocyclales bacterium]|jgi:PAS domain S-box-containing protein|nr:PAS domain S-box protein [Rhodocyclales bacterium]MBI5784789.1 PAS domain S-box protein [Rhodocyclales bacterium]